MPHTNVTNTGQQYQLKLGVVHDPSLKTVQLIEFLENECNDFLSNDLPQYVKGEERFVNVMETLNIDMENINSYEFQQFVGLLFIYSTSSDQSYQHIIHMLQHLLSSQSSQLFMIIVQMDNSQKSANLIGNAGERFCTKNNLQFVRLTLHNSEDLIAMINKNLYELIQNYYYPNQEVGQEIGVSNNELQVLVGRGKGQQQQQQIQLLQHQHGLIEDVILRQASSNPITERKSQQLNQTDNGKNGQYIFSYDNQSRTIDAYNQSYSPKVQNPSQMISHAASLRKSRQHQNSLHQQNLDESIQNIQNVLNNINHRIKEKLNSGWFTEVKTKLYSTAEKDNTNFSKIKLTQEFIDESPERNKRLSVPPSVFHSRYSDLLHSSSRSFALNFNTLKFNITSIKTPLLRLVLFLSKVRIQIYHTQDKVVQLQIYENSTYDELALIAIRRLQLRQTDKNIEKMVGKIKKRVEGFSKQLHRAIKQFQEKSNFIFDIMLEIQQRSFVKSKTNLHLV